MGCRFKLLESKSSVTEVFLVSESPPVLLKLNIVLYHNSGALAHEVKWCCQNLLHLRTKHKLNKEKNHYPDRRLRNA